MGKWPRATFSQKENNIILNSYNHPLKTLENLINV